MCNDYRLLVDIASIAEDFDDLQIKIKLPEGKPNVAAREDIMITDVAPIVKGIAGERGAGELVNRRWSWPGPRGKPVFNFRSDGREFASHRCLIVCDGFYETTDPVIPKQKRLDKWLFTLKDHDWFCMAGVWREHEGVGEAFSLLTMDAGPDIAPYHDRQIIPLTRDLWADWLDPSVPAGEVLRHLPAGSLIPTQVWPPPGNAPQQISLDV
ncbi:SOS response-associated peptidase [Novosphingobium sp. G106]|uniref:SOS response-associated peptidase family protein n=1 Tax=Novosphingobium sp. G106 TaxID=2849500 RepID=UPI001C2DC36B|nr:SOS response-associated peptidase [Novosphingobium sp. G106]MBV1687824.1 SOS response-associated peptidase [Novosphingobium sp. G106]